MSSHQTLVLVMERSCTCISRDPRLKEASTTDLSRVELQEVTLDNAAMPETGMVMYYDTSARDGASYLNALVHAPLSQTQADTHALFRRNASRPQGQYRNDVIADEEKVLCATIGVCSPNQNTRKYLTSPP